jgi:cytochrome c peroxidase
MRGYATITAAALVLGPGCRGVDAPPPLPPDPLAADGEVLLSAAAIAALRQLSPLTLPAPPPDPTNRFADDPAAAALGQRFFFDPGFSGALLDDDNIGSTRTLGRVGEAGKVACAGCHIPGAGFVDDRSVRQTISLAAGWGRRKALSLLDVGQAKIVMWDGRHDAHWNQPFEAIESAVDMNSSRLYVAEQIYLRYRAPYQAVFGAIPIPLDDGSRFPRLTGAGTGCRMLVPDDAGQTRKGDGCHGMPGDQAEYDHLGEADQTEVTRIVVNLGKALEAYQRLLTCGASRFDRWVHGQADALTSSEKRGAALFVGQRQDGSLSVGCNSCHGGPFLTDRSFHNVGLSPSPVGPAANFSDPDDRGALAGLTAALADPLNVRGLFSDGDDGRLPSAVAPALDGAFKTPSLRCVGRRPSLMHTGQLGTLADAVAFFDRGGDSAGFPGTSELSPRHLSLEEKADLTAFLAALDGPGPDPRLLQAP